MRTSTICTYVWLDRHGNLRSKRRQENVDREIFGLHKDVFKYFKGGDTHLCDIGISDWSFDGSSTGQARTDDSDVGLKPVSFLTNQTQTGLRELIVLCETINIVDQTPHSTNTRAKLREVINNNDDIGLLLGFEQEYTLFSRGRPLAFGFSKDVENIEQGPFYCGVGAPNVYGAHIADAFYEKMVPYDILYGMNAEVMPGQWEFQTCPLSPLDAADVLQLSRFMLMKTAEMHHVEVSLDPKPDARFNGAGLHTNFSTYKTRDLSDYELAVPIIKAVAKEFEKTHVQAMGCYGEGIERRLIGTHETASIDKFTVGVADRYCSMRIPVGKNMSFKGYLEDRRPCANADPYSVVKHILENMISIEKGGYNNAT